MIVAESSVRTIVESHAQTMREEEELKSEIQDEGVEILGEIDCSCDLSRDLGWGITLVPKDSFLYNQLTPIVDQLEKIK